MSSIELTGVAKSYGSRTVIEGLDLSVTAGSFTVLVGASGCGKSTTLRMIAGLEQPTAGTIAIGGTDMANVAPGERGVAMVFQNYALYPTMTVAQNIEYGLRNNKVPKSERRALVEEIAETVGLTDHLRKRPDALSGGERQRVALARAMVKKPAVFLMDEPLSNLDAKLRQHMRGELIELHQRLGATFVYVTHDQVEAMSMGTAIVLMDAGTIVQESSPDELYRSPQNTFAAKFIGSPAMNIVAAETLADAPANAAYAGFRPEQTEIAAADAAPETAAALAPGRTIFAGTIVSSENLGAERVYRVRLTSGDLVAARSFDIDTHLAGDVTLSVASADLAWFGADEQRLPDGHPLTAERPVEARAFA